MPRKSRKQLTAREKFHGQMNKALRDSRGVTLGGEPDRDSNSMKVSDWMRREARRGTIQKPLQGEGE